MGLFSVFRRRAPGAAAAAAGGSPRPSPGTRGAGGDPAFGVRPVDPGRIRTALDALSYRYFVDSSGEIGGLWDNRLFSFYLVGTGAQLLQVRGRWPRRVALERLPAMLEFTDAWNRERIFPKCYVRVLDDGMVHITTEVSVPVAHGLSDVQLEHHLQLGLMSGMMVFDHLDEMFPDPVALQPDGA